MAEEEKESIIERLFLAGLGLLSTATSEAKKVIDKAVKEGKIQRKEGEKLLKEFTKKAEAQTKEVRKIVVDEINAALSKVGIASKKEFDQVLKRIEKLEDRLVRRKKVAKKEKEEVTPTPPTVT